MTIAQLLAAGTILVASPALSDLPAPIPASIPATAIDSTTTTDEVAIGNRGDRMPARPSR